MRLFLSLFFISSFHPAMAQESMTTYDGFVDLYYAYDLNEPPNIDREYTTQPARHNEFNANLIMMGVEHEQGPLRAKLSLQAGTYVQSNYSAEPTKGSISGGTLSRHIQDAYITYEAGKKTSIIAGIFASHIGYENLLSMDNFTYTRSFAADFSPYYQTGAGIIHNLSNQWIVEGYVINGWQNISEDDSNKALGSAVRYVSEDFKFNYSNFFGKYLERGLQFHDVNISLPLTSKINFKALFDLGIRDHQGESKTFYTTNAQLQYKLTNLSALGFRYEYYHDPYNLNVSTTNGLGFKVHSLSLNYDNYLSENFLWRIEYRHFLADDPIFSSDKGIEDGNGLAVMSLAARFK